jgi:hypothetical protein
MPHFHIKRFTPVQNVLIVHKFYVRGEDVFMSSLKNDYGTQLQGLRNGIVVIG